MIPSVRVSVMGYSCSGMLDCVTFSTHKYITIKVSKWHVWMYGSRFKGITKLKNLFVEEAIKIVNKNL